MAYTRGRRSREETPEEPEPTMGQLLAFLVRQEERRAAKQARREEDEARRANAPHRGNVDSFFKLHPPSFHASEGALAAEDWVKEVGKFLAVAKIAEEDKVIAMSYSFFRSICT